MMARGASEGVSFMGEAAGRAAGASAAGAEARSEQPEASRAAQRARRPVIRMPEREGRGASSATPNLRLPWPRPAPTLRGRMLVTVNDEPRDTAARTLDGLLRELGVAEQAAVAAAVDGQVVPRSRWPEKSLAEGCSVVVIRAAQGG